MWSRDRYRIKDPSKNRSITENMEKIVLIDGHSILNRAYYGVPDLTNSEGLHTNAVYGFLNIMFKILDEEKPDYFAVAFDLKAPTFRHKMYEQYKGTRKPMQEELRQQVPVIKEMLTAMKVPLMMLEGYEADDLLGTVAKKAEADGLEAVVVSGDRDLLQLGCRSYYDPDSEDEKGWYRDRELSHGRCDGKVPGDTDPDHRIKSIDGRFF